jgi:hypothetical protein
MTDRTPVEIAMIGREGMYRVSAILSDINRSRRLWCNLPAVRFG